MEARDKPRMTGGSHPLPFEKLAPLEFERMCLWLVRREGYERAEHLGEAGSDQGRDVLAWRDGRRVVFQCKRVQAFTQVIAKREIDKLRALPIEKQPQELVFVVSRTVSADLRAAIRSDWGDEGSCHFWVGNELDERVKRHPEILREFFQLLTEGLFEGSEHRTTKKRRRVTWALSILGVVFSLLVWHRPWSGVSKIVLAVHDLDQRPLSGFRFAYAGYESRETTSAGATELELPARLEKGELIKIQLLSSTRSADDWFIMEPQVTISSNPVNVLLMRRSAIRALKAEIDISPEDILRVVRHYRLSSIQQLETIIASFAETGNSEDRKVAADLYERIATKREVVDINFKLRHVNIKQVIARQSQEASARRALSIELRTYGPSHPRVALRLNNLAQFLRGTGRLAAAESLTRRALAIDKSNYGTNYPTVAADLKNLVQLLWAMGRLSEAEPLARQRLTILLELGRRTGQEHPNLESARAEYAELLAEMGKTRAEVETVIESLPN